MIRGEDGRCPRSPRPPDLEDVVAALEGIRSGSSAGERAHAVERLGSLLEFGYSPPASLATEARLIAACRWLLNDRPDHPVIPVWAARATHVLAALDDERLAALLAGFSFDYAIRVGDFGEAGRLVAQMWERTAADAEARRTWLPSAALFLCLTGRPEAALQTLQPDLDDAAAAPSLRFALLEQACSAALAAGDAVRCRRYLEGAEALPLTLSDQDRAHIAFLRAGAAAVAGEPDGADAAIGQCEACAREVEARFFKALWRLGAAVLRLQGGHERRAERELSELLGDVVLMRARYLQWSVRLARAAARRALRRPAAAEADLVSALRIARENGYVTCDPWGLTRHLRELMALAVERGIEAHTARLVLAQRA
jgi:hypothetical protein